MKACYAKEHDEEGTMCKGCADEAVQSLADKLAEAEKELAEYRDKVPHILTILSRVKQFDSLDDNTYANQVVEFFKAQ